MPETYIEEYMPDGALLETDMEVDGSFIRVTQQVDGETFVVHLSLEMIQWALDNIP